MDLLSSCIAGFRRSCRFLTIIWPETFVPWHNDLAPIDIPEALRDTHATKRPPEAAVFVFARRIWPVQRTIAVSELVIATGAPALMTRAF